MNFAFTTVIFLFLVSPGFFARFYFLSGPYSTRFNKTRLADELFWSIIPAFGFHLIGILFVTFLLGKEILYKDIIYLLLFHKTEGVDIDSIGKSIIPFFFYMGSLDVVAILAGYRLRHYIINKRLDDKYSTLKINNEWYYILSGRLLKKGKLEFIQIDVLTTFENKSVIYSGILGKYFLTKEGGLDRFYLYRAYRRDLSDDKKDDSGKVFGSGLKGESSVLMKELDERYYNMPGDFFVIQYSVVKNMNVSYYTEKEVNQIVENILNSSKEQKEP